MENRAKKNELQYGIEAEADIVLAKVILKENSFCNEMISKHKWLPADSTISIETGWVALVDQMLTEIGLMLGKKTQNNCIKFFCIQVKRETMDCSIHACDAMSKRKADSLTVLIDEFARQATELCAYCGVFCQSEDHNFSSRSFNKCDAHKGFLGRRIQLLIAKKGAFYEASQKEISRLSQVVPSWYTPENDELANKLISEKLEKKNKEFLRQQTEEEAEAEFEAAFRDDSVAVRDIDAPTDESTSITPRDIPAPVHTLYNVAAVDAMLERLDRTYSDRTVKERQKLVLIEMKKLGGTRPYGKVDDAESFCDDLEHDFPNFKEAVDLIRLDLALSSANGGRLRIRPMLLAGDPGLGKTAFANALAERLGGDLHVESMAGAQTSASLTGTASHWSNAQTGSLHRVLVNGKTCSPVVLVDELDKAPVHSQYNPVDSLYALLEESTAKVFEDQCMLGVKFDTTSVIWLLTANDISVIAAPLLTRMVVVNVSLPDAVQSFAIAKRIYKIMMVSKYSAWSFNEDLPDDIAEKLVGITPRLMKKEIENALAKAIIDKRHHVTESDFNFAKEVKKCGIGFMSNSK